MSVRIGYGLSEDAEYLAGLAPEAVGEMLREAGFDGVFLKTLELPWVTGLKRAGLRVYSSLGIFMRKGMWQTYPNARPITAAGTPAPQQDWYEPAIPTLPTLRAARLEEITRLCSSLPLDGLWLDFIRWPAKWEEPELQLYDSSFDPVTLEQFRKDTGISWPPQATSPKEIAGWLLSEAQEPWLNWRCEQILTFAEAARERLKNHLPEALLGMFIIPWPSHEVVDGFPNANIRIVGQDLKRLSDFADVFSPMVYHRLCGKDTLWIRSVTRWAETESPRPVWPVIESIKTDQAYSASEFSATCEAALSGSSQTVVAFTLEGVLADPAKLDVWKAR